MPFVIGAGKHGEVHPGAYRQLSEDLSKVVVHGVRRDVQPVGDLLIGQSLADQDRCRRLLRNERGERAARAGGSTARLEPLEVTER
ncbi:hypothetical protein [Micromonospora zamorensis]